MNDPIRPIQEEELHAFVDGRLPPARRAEVEERLAQDPQLRERLADWQHQAQALRDAFAFKAREPVPQTLHLGRLVETRISRRALHWRVAAGFLLALSIGSMGGGAAGWSLRGQRRSSDMAWLTMQAASAHKVFAADDTRPVELGPTDRATLVSWMSDRLGRHIGVPDLTRLGYRFIGGRVLAAVGGPAAMLMYDDAAGQRITVYVQPMHRTDALPMQPVEADTVNGYAWINHQVGYGVMSNGKDDALHMLANKVRDDMKS